MDSKSTQLASRIESDIVRRGLRPGDRYLTASEAGDLLNVSSMTANRAMQMLADRGVLVRHRSRGTFVGPQFRSTSAPPHPFDAVHLVVSLDHHAASGVTIDHLVESLRSAYCDVAVEIHFLPEYRATAAMERLLDRPVSGPQREGFILVLTSRAIQSMVQRSGVPAVIYGQPYPGIELSCLQHDQAAIGTMMAEFALAQGHTRIALLTRSRWRRGDNLMHDAVAETLARGGIALNDLTLRSVAPDEEAIADVVAELLGAAAPPTVFLCRNDFFAQAVLDAAAQLDSAQSTAIEVISGGHAQRNEAQGFCRIVSTMSIHDQMDRLVELLSAAAQGKRCQALTIPVEVDNEGEGTARPS